MQKTLVGFGVLALLCTKITAQDAVRQDSLKTQKLDEVVVSDSRFELKRENSGKTVITISAEELKRNQGRTIAQVINTQSGIEISGSRGRDGDVLGVYVRGGRGRQVLVLIDGIRVSDPASFSPQYDLRLLSTDMVESIEIIKGASSTLYGPNAATAVINITTKKSAEKKVAGNFKSTVGTNQTSEDQNFNASHFSNSAQVSGTTDKFSYQAGISNRFSDGISAAVTPENEEDAFSQYSADVRLGYRFSDDFKVSVFGNKTEYKNEFDADRTEADNNFEQNQERAGLTADFGYGKGSLQLNTSYSEFTSESISSFGESISNGNNFFLDIFNKYIIGEKWHTVLGLNYIEDRAVFSERADFTIVDPYANVVFVSGSGLNLNAGARLNTHSEYGNTFVYNLNPSYAIPLSEGYLKIFGSYATAYITPALIELYGDFGANPDLEPEENRTFEGGLEYAVNDKLRFSTLYFNRNEKNKIAFAQNMIMNISEEIDVSGIETELSWQPLSTLNISANYTFVERMGDNAIRIPKHKLNATAGYQFSERTFGSISYQYTGERLDTDFTTFTDVELDPFSLVNLYFGHELMESKLRVFLQLDNLLNEEYTEVLGFNTRGANVRVGFSLNL